MSDLDQLRAAFRAALRERDAIESCSSPEWLAAHRRAGVAEDAMVAEERRLASLVVGIPYRLAFRMGTNGREVVYRGESDAAGDAGWTVRRVPRERAREELRSIPRSAWCPATFRLAAELGL